MEHRGLDTEVAVVGLAGLFPRSRSVGEFWKHIVAQSDCIEDIPASRWSLEDHYDSDRKTPDKTYSRRGGFIPSVDFDPLEFGLPPKSLESIDTAQMLALLVARDALADAGYGAGRDFSRERTGVILGVSGTTMKLQAPLRSRLDFPHWSRIMTAAGVAPETVDDILHRASRSFVPWTEDSFPGMLANVVSGRIANRLNLGGINCAVDAACASALCAVNFAIGSLVSHNCDMVITGGVDVDNSIQAYMSFSKTPVLSLTQCIRPFDAAADGTLISEAVAMLVLKRRQDAIRDGDRIYAVIRGIGVSSDGRCESIYAPRSEGQARALRQAYDQAGVSPAKIDLVEAHATGTQVGDAVEFRALSEVFGEAGAAEGSVAVGSIKSQFGHAKAAAGALSLIKTVLALHHKVLPPTIHIDQPNPTLNSTGAPFYFSTETRPWIGRSDGTPRRAGISASGFGGANYHVVLEEAQSEPDTAYRMHDVPWVGFVSASSPITLRERCAEIVGQIERGGDARELLTATEPVVADHPRIAFAARDNEQALTRLAQCVEMLSASPLPAAVAYPEGIWYRQSSVEGKVAAVFPGQGSQYVGMGRDLALDFPEHRTVMAEADAVFAAGGHAPLSGVVFPKPAAKRDRAEEERRLRRTLYAQTSVAAMSMSTWRLLKTAGFAPDYALGHSLGELTALWAGGSIDGSDILRIIRARGEAFSPAEGTEAGALTAVTAHAGRVNVDIAGFADVRVANINGPEQTVIGGAKAALDEAERSLEQKGYNLSRLPVAAAFHTPSVSYGAKPWGEALSAAKLHAPQFPVCSNTTGDFHEASGDAVRSLLARHPLEPVRFMECVERLYAEGVRVFVEVGPRSILSRLISQTLGDRPHAIVATNPNREGSASLQLQQAAAQLMAAGIWLGPIDRYQMPQPPQARTLSGVTIKLEAGNYLLPETQERMREAITPAPQAARPLIREVSEAPAVAPRNGKHAHETAIAPPTAITQRESLTMSAPQPLQAQSSIAQDALMRLYELEHAQIDVHRQFLAGQQTQAALLGQLAQQQSTLAGFEGGAPAWERVVERVVEHQGATVGVHQSYLDMQAHVANLMIELAHGSGSTTTRDNAYAPAEAPAARNGHVKYVDPPSLAAAPPPQVVAPVPAAVAPPAPIIHFATPAPAPQPNAATAFADQLLEIVSQKTGYPVDLIGLDSDLEADLGIDSIKRIEILASLPSAGNAGIAKSRLSELRTLREILAVMSPQANAPVPYGETVHGKHDSAIVQPPTATPAAVSTQSIADELLQIVSQKTGYPVDLIGLDSDLEADLGIDSIKRIEILASLPNANSANAGKSHLSELRTLREILAVMTPSPGIELATPASVSSTHTETNSTRQTIQLQGPPPGVIQIEPLPPLAFRVADLALLPREHGIVILSDGTEVALSLSSLFGQAGYGTAIIDPHASSSPAESGSPHIALHGIDGANIALALQTATDRVGPIGAVIYLHAAKKDSSHEGLKLALLLAKHAGASLQQASAHGRPAFITAVHMDGQLGVSGNTADPSAGGLFGLAKSLRQEWSGVHCRAVDLGPSGSSVAERLAAELADPQTWPAEVAHTASGRSTLAVASLSIGSSIQNAVAITEKSTLLVTGGARGVTASCAIALAKQFRCRLVLFGRTRIDAAEEAWSLGISDHAELKRRLVQHMRDRNLEATPKSVEAQFTALIHQREAQATLAAIRDVGAAVQYKAVDISNAQDISDVLKDISPIDGLIHGAGVIADSRIERKTAAEFDRVFAPKVDGLENLLHYLDLNRLRHVVLFSSTAAVSGNAGQSDYAMANEVLNKRAFELKRQMPDCRVVSICWGPWDGGMVTAELARRFEARGIRTISKDMGAAFMIDRLLQGSDAPVQVVLGDLLPATSDPPESKAVSSEFAGVRAAAVAHDRADEEATV